MARYFKTDGTITDVNPKNGTDFSLEELQKAVDGYIEIVYLQDDDIAVVNEEGIIRKMPHNINASIMVGFPVFGDVLICKSNEVK